MFNDANNTVTVSKDKLLEQLEQNRREHNIIFEEALKGWKDQVIKGLAKALALAKDDKKFITDLDLEKPVWHIKEYDAIIERVNWHVGDTIELSIREFNQFIMDRWDWQDHFLNTSSSYSSSSSSSSASSLIESKLNRL